MIVNMTKFGEIVDQSSDHTVELTGSYHYDMFNKGYWYEVKNVEPFLPLNEIFSEKFLF